MSRLTQVTPPLAPRCHPRVPRPRPIGLKLQIYTSKFASSRWLCTHRQPHPRLPQPPFCVASAKPYRSHTRFNRAVIAPRVSNAPSSGLRAYARARSAHKAPLAWWLQPLVPPPLPRLSQRWRCCHLARKCRSSSHPRPPVCVCLAIIYF